MAERPTAEGNFPIMSEPQTLARGEDREGGDPGTLGPESCPLQAGRARARKLGKGVQEVRSAVGSGIVPCGRQVGRW